MATLPLKTSAPAFLFVVLVVLLLFRISREESAYQTPDSLLYLHMANSMGKPTGYVPHSETVRLYPLIIEEVPVSLFPYGYPSLIRLIHELTGLALLPASKLLNLLLLGGCIVYIRRRYGEISWMPMALFFGVAMLGAFSSTLSEAPFVFILLLWTGRYQQFIQADRVNNNTLLYLLLLSVALFLCRYVGFFLLPVYGLLLVYYLYQGQPYKARQIGLVALGLLVFVAAYFTANYYTTGYASGTTRIILEPWKYVVGVILDASINELFFYRKWYVIFNPSIDIGFIVAALLQLGLMLSLFLSIKHKKAVGRALLRHPLWLPAIVFYLTITTLRVASPFLYDLRTLLPFTVLAWLILWDSLQVHEAANPRFRPIIATAIGLGVIMGALYL